MVGLSLELPCNVRLRIIGNEKIQRKSFKFLELKKSAWPAAKIKRFLLKELQKKP